MRWKPKMMLILSSLAPPLFLEQLPGIRLSFCRVHLDLLCVSFVSKGTRSCIPSEEFRVLHPYFIRPPIDEVDPNSERSTNKQKKNQIRFPFHFPSRKNKTIKNPTLRKSKTNRFLFGASQCLPPQGDSLHPRNSSNCSGHAWTMGVSTSPFTLPETNSEFTPENGWSWNTSFRLGPGLFSLEAILV